jgi:hypothetical protein
MHWEAQFRRQASRQESLVARFQLPGMGCDYEHWRRARRSGRWTDRSPQVIALAGSPETESQRVLAAVLDASPGAALHGRSTLAWMRIGPFDLREIQTSRPRGLSGAPATLSTVHRLRALRPHDLVVVRGVVSESALRAIWTEAARYAAPQLEDIGAQRIGALLDIGHRLGLVTWAALAEMVDDIQQRGRAGTRLMRVLAEARPPGSSPTESRQESRLEEILHEAGQRSLTRQRVVGGHEPIGRTDHRDDQLPLVIETNSETFHTTPTDRAADELRYERLTQAGFTVGVVWENDLWKRPRAVVATVVDARRLAARGGSVVVHSPGCPWVGVRIDGDASTELTQGSSHRLAS